MSGSQQQDVLTLPAMVTMTVGRWNQVLEFLGQNKWVDVNPLIVDIHRQIQDAVGARRNVDQGQTVAERQSQA